MVIRYAFVGFAIVVSATIARGQPSTTAQDNANLAETRTKAEAGDPEAQSNLGWAYYNGDGVAEDAVEAVKWFRRSAEQGNASGQNRLGVAYQYGKGVPKDVAQAIAWYRRGADQGLLQAQLNLAWTYNNGVGVPRDYAQAAVWYRKAAEQGHAGAQSDLGVAYGNGEGVKKDKREAERWFQKARDQGYAVATFHIASMYWNEEFGGGGVIGLVAIDNFQKAAAQGYPLSAVTLGEIYTRRTRYTARDDQQACMWTVVAEALDKRNEWERRQPAATAEVRRKLPELVVRVRRNLTEQQLKDCDSEAREWLAAQADAATRSRPSPKPWSRPAKSSHPRSGKSSKCSACLPRRPRQRAKAAISRHAGNPGRFGERVHDDSQPDRVLAVQFFSYFNM